MSEDNRNPQLSAGIGLRAVFQGIAWNGKVCATLEVPGQASAIYIEGLKSWDEWGQGIAGSRVSVIGTLRRKRLLPEFQVSKSGAIRQGAVGEQYVLENAQLVGDGATP